VFCPALALLLLPQPASAHLVSTGLGPFYDGLTHLWLTPEDLLPTLALALLAGLRSREHGRLVLFALPAVWLVGGLLGLAVGSGPSPTWSTLTFIVVGGLVVADADVSVPALAGLTMVIGLLHGFVNGVDLASLGLGVSGLMGIVLSIFVLLSLTAAVVVSREEPWFRVAVRVAGSWVVAVGLLMLGWMVNRAG
jgi:hydrogenase/urease accessory protein HupE